MDTFDEVLAAAERDSRIVGLILGGSRGKGFGTERSDRDVYLILDDWVERSDLVRSTNTSPAVQIDAVPTLEDFARRGAYCR